MGEMADQIINGDFCEQCGEWMGDGPGYPQTCDGCEGDGNYSLDLTEIE